MSQKLNDDFKNNKIEIKENDLFTYFIQRKYWPKMFFEEFEEEIVKHGVIIIKEEKNNYDDKNKSKNNKED